MKAYEWFKMLADNSDIDCGIMVVYLKTMKGGIIRYCHIYWDLWGKIYYVPFAR